MIESKAAKVLGFIIAAAGVGSLGAGLFVLERDYDQLSADLLQLESEHRELAIENAVLRGMVMQSSKTDEMMSKIIRTQSEIVKVLNER